MIFYFYHRQKQYYLPIKYWMIIDGHNQLPIWLRIMRWHMIDWCVTEEETYSKSSPPSGSASSCGYISTKIVATIKIKVHLTHTWHEQQAQLIAQPILAGSRAFHLLTFICQAEANDYLVWISRNNGERESAIKFLRNKVRLDQPAVAVI